MLLSCDINKVAHFIPLLVNRHLYLYLIDFLPFFLRKQHEGCAACRENQRHQCLMLLSDSSRAQPGYCSDCMGPIHLLFYLLLLFM